MNKPRAIENLNVLGLIVLHLVITLPLAYLLNIWADEASTLYTTQHGFTVAFQNALRDEEQAPLYFWLISLWRDLNGSIFFARLFSIICSVVAIKYFSDLARKLFSRGAAIPVSAFFALHPFLIWASLEIRVYSFVILLTVLLLTFFVDGFWSEPAAKTSRKKQVYFLLVAVVALYTNFYLGFLLAGCFAALLATKRWRKMWEYTAMMVLAGIIVLPLALEAKWQLAAKTSGFPEERTFLEGLRNLWHHCLTFLLPAQVFPRDDASLFPIARVWIVRTAIVALVILKIRTGRGPGKRTLAFGTIAATVLLLLLAAYFILGAQYVQVRHAAVLFVPLIVFAASFLMESFSREKRHIQKYAALVLGAVIAIFFSYSLATMYPDLAKRGDWRRVGEYIRLNERPGQPIIVFTVFDALAMPYHYGGVNRVLPETRFFDFEGEAAVGTADSLKRQTDFVISVIPPGANEIWLIENEKCLVTEACRPLENYVQANYTVVQEKEFYLEKVFLLRKRSQ